jgi:hypothetical protein
MKNWAWAVLAFGIAVIALAVLSVLYFLSHLAI